MKYGRPSKLTGAWAELAAHLGSTMAVYAMLRDRFSISQSGATAITKGGAMDAARIASILELLKEQLGGDWIWTSQGILDKTRFIQGDEVEL